MAKQTAEKWPKGDNQWFVHDRFGMFIHWGTYALAARHEWVKHHERITERGLPEVLRSFQPGPLRPHGLGPRRRPAGMKYFVITTKHHEGFCLWDSEFTDYKATNTPYGKDLLAPMVEAFRDEGLHVGFYHSLIDWHHPDFPIDRIHPQRDDKAFRKKEQEPRRPQVRGVPARPGPRTADPLWQLDILWFDFSYPGQGRQGPQGLAVREAGQDDPRALPGHPDRQPARPARLRRLRHARAVPAARVADGRQGKPRGLGSLPDVLRLVGLSPRRDRPGRASSSSSGC